MKRRFPMEEENNGRYCPQCGQRVPRTYRGETCPACEEEELYQKVKNYIQTHDVTAMDVSDEFGIPLAQVKDWIENGYFVYRKDQWY